MCKNWLTRKRICTFRLLLLLRKKLESARIYRKASPSPSFLIDYVLTEVPQREAFWPGKKKAQKAINAVLLLGRSYSVTT